MPWSRMYSPVRRCQKNELSESPETPTAQPNSAKTAENTAPKPQRDARAVSTGAGTDGAYSTVARESVGVAVMTSERARDLDDRRPEDHDEDRREDAEHQREEHLHRGLLCLLLRAQPATDPHLVSLCAQQAGDRHTERVGLEHGEDECAQLGH